MRISAYDELIAMIRKINGGGLVFREDEDSASNFSRVGPREGRIGLNEEDQRILSCTITNKNCRAIMLEITYLAAGFILGYKGESMKQIWSKTGASIRSTLIHNKEEQFGVSTIRLFHISGSCYQILKTLQIFKAAVNRYKDLLDGQKANIVVDGQQVIEGIIFQYCPPPIDASPNAARTMKFTKQASKKTFHSDSTSYTCIESKVMKPQMMKYGVLRTGTSPPQSSPSSVQYISLPQSPLYDYNNYKQNTNNNNHQCFSPASFHPSPTPKCSKTPGFDMTYTPQHVTPSKPKVQDHNQGPYNYNYHEQQKQFQFQSHYQYPVYLQNYIFNQMSEYFNAGFNIQMFNHGLLCERGLQAVSQGAYQQVCVPDQYFTANQQV